MTKKVAGELTCAECKEFLFQEKPSSMPMDIFTLLLVKNRGGLKVPADGVIKLLTCAEKHLRAMQNVHAVNRSHSGLQLETSVLSEVGLGIFSMDEHMRATGVVVDNHYFDLLKLLIRTYFNLRMHHVCSLHNMKLQGAKKRQKLTKLVIFSGQWKFYGCKMCVMSCIYTL